MTKKKSDQFRKNLIKFTVPLLIVMFTQLSLGADWKTAGMVALYASYAAIVDLLKKLK